MNKKTIFKYLVLRHQIIELIEFKEKNVVFPIVYKTLCMDIYIVLHTTFIFKTINNCNNDNKHFSFILEKEFYCHHYRYVTFIYPLFDVIIGGGMKIWIDRVIC